MSYPKNTAEALEYLYPDADPSRDWSVLYVNENTRDITHWDSKLGEKPSVEKIKKAESKISEIEEKLSKENFIWEETNAT